MSIVLQINFDSLVLVVVEQDFIILHSDIQFLILIHILYSVLVFLYMFHVKSSENFKEIHLNLSLDFFLGNSLVFFTIFFLCFRDRLKDAIFLLLI